MRMARVGSRRLLLCLLIAVGVRTGQAETGLIRDVQEAREQGHWAEAEQALMLLRKQWQSRDGQLLTNFLLAEAKLRQGSRPTCAKIARAICSDKSGYAKHLELIVRQVHSLLVHAEARPIIDALEDYYAEHVEFPPKLATATEPAIDRKSLTDFWGTPYKYRVRANQAAPGVSRQQYELASAGPDRRHGTADDTPYRRDFPLPSRERRTGFELRNSWGGYVALPDGGAKQCRVGIKDRTMDKVTFVLPGEPHQGARLVTATRQFAVLLDGPTILIIEKPR